MSSFHPGPRIDKIPIAGGIGLVIVIGLMIGFLAEVPATRLWFFIALPIGILVAFVLYFRRRT